MSEVALDDFLGGSGSDGAIGALGWRSGAGTVTPGSGTTDHPGIVALVTGASANDTCRIHLGRTVSTPIADIGQILRWQACAAMASTANILVRIGWGTDISAASFGTDGVFWEYSSGVGSWTWNTQSGSSLTTVSTSLTGTTGYVTLASYRQGSRWIGVHDDGTTVTLVTSAGDEPAAGTDLNAGLYVETLTAAAKTLTVDAWGARYGRSTPARLYL